MKFTPAIVLAILATLSVAIPQDVTDSADVASDEATVEADDSILEARQQTVSTVWANGNFQGPSIGLSGGGCRNLRASFNDRISSISVINGWVCNYWK